QIFILAQYAPSPPELIRHICRIVWDSRLNDDVIQIRGDTEASYTVRNLLHCNSRLFTEASAVIWEDPFVNQSFEAARCRRWELFDSIFHLVDTGDDIPSRAVQRARHYLSCIKEMTTPHWGAIHSHRLSTQKMLPFMTSLRRLVGTAKAVTEDFPTSVCRGLTHLTVRGNTLSLNMGEKFPNLVSLNLASFNALLPFSCSSRVEILTIELTVVDAFASVVEMASQLCPLLKELNLNAFLDLGEDDSEKHQSAHAIAAVLDRHFPPSQLTILRLRGFTLTHPIKFDSLKMLVIDGGCLTGDFPASLPALIQRCSGTLEALVLKTHLMTAAQTRMPICVTALRRLRILHTSLQSEEGLPIPLDLEMGVPTWPLIELVFLHEPIMSIASVKNMIEGISGTVKMLGIVGSTVTDEIKKEVIMAVLERGHFRG
ncbi:hypothetical protein BC829DRAFT_54976, partial [Chytridium lagenaria]